MSTHLFNLTTEWAVLEELLLDAGGELTEETEAKLAQLVQDTPACIERAGFAKLSLQTRVAVAKDRIAALRVAIERAQAAEARIDGALEKILVKLGKAQRFPEFTLSTRKSERHDFALAQGAEIYELDAKYWRQADPELNKSELKAALKAGQLPQQIHAETTTTVAVTLRRNGKDDAAADAA